VRAALTSLISLGLLIAAFVYYGNRLPHFKQESPEQRAEGESSSDAKDIGVKQLDPDELIKNPKKVMAVDGPLARWMKDGNSEGSSGDSGDATEKRAPWKAHANDHIAPSPVGTSGVVLHKTFSISKGASFAFMIPAHAATPQLRGTFHSSALASQDASANENADIAFLLLSQEQYDGFLHGHLGDSLVSVDSSHNQNVNFGLPASLNEPVTYYLVFTNNPREGRKTVQADFAVNF
jgi:hypothetical protein